MGWFRYDRPDDREMGLGNKCGRFNGDRNTAAGTDAERRACIGVTGRSGGLLVVIPAGDLVAAMHSLIHTGR